MLGLVSYIWKERNMFSWCVKYSCSFAFALSMNSLQKSINQFGDTNMIRRGHMLSRERRQCTRTHPWAMLELHLSIVEELLLMLGFKRLFIFWSVWLFACSQRETPGFGRKMCCKLFTCYAARVMVDRRPRLFSTSASYCQSGTFRNLIGMNRQAKLEDHRLFRNKRCL